MNIEWKEESPTHYIGEYGENRKCEVYAPLYHDGWYADIFTSLGFSREINNPEHDNGAWPTLEAAQQACQESVGLNK